MKVLSLFDGMSCGMIALRKMGIQPDRYVAYEIDKYAIKTTQHNFPEIEQKGNVFNANFTEYKDIDLLCGGSPCQHWSISQKKNRETEASGIGWDLFCQYVRALREAQPKYFLYENNKSMSNAIRESITKTFRFEPIMIDSALLSAQTRKRLYWIGKREPDGTYSKVDIKLPEDKGILLKDIIECGTVDREKAHVLKHQAGNAGGAGGKTGLYAFPVNASDGKSRTIKAQYAKTSIANICKYESTYGASGVAEAVGYAEPCEWDTYGNPIKAISNADGKAYKVYKITNGQINVNGVDYPIRLEDGYYIIRKLTVTECMRLQTVPEWYKFPVSDTQAYKMLGNGWCIDVIAHLLRNLKKENENE